MSHPGGRGVPPERWHSALWAELQRYQRVWGEEARRETGKETRPCHVSVTEGGLGASERLEPKAEDPSQSLGFGIEQVTSWL